MILCHCNGVSDRAVRAAVECGASDLDQVMAACGAAGDCGGCRASVEAVLDEQPSRVLVQIGS